MTGVAALALVLMLGATAAHAAFTARGSAEQVYVTGASPGARMALLDSRGRRVGRGKVNALGGLLFRNVRPGSGYRVRQGRAGETSGPLTVISNRSAPPSTDIYNQEIPSSGYGYLTTRDGTKLAYYVHPPQDVTNVLPEELRPPPTPSGAPVPTLIEYSGYGYANPAGPNSGIAIVANLLGFAVVDVNMRGTGCSGGAFDFFEPLQSLDGYDVIETVARQPWVMHNKVGMFGISYGGISQLFTAATQPPSLAAISPLSVIDGVQTTLYPGGVLNTGFAVEWARERQREALPASENGGQRWAHQRIQEGDETCRENQALHPEAANLMAKIRANNTYNPRVVDPLTPRTFVHKIKVPTFLVCQWQDEQTGGHCPTLASRLTGTDRKWITFTNGTHVDSLGPETANRLYDFLSIYVARQTPATRSAFLKASAPVLYDAAMGVSGVQMPRDPVQEQPTYEGAKQVFESFPSVRLLFDNGAGGSQPGQPLPGFERSFDRFPIPGTRARAWYLAPGGALAERRPARPRADGFRADARARPLTNFTGDTGSGEGGLWTATPPYNWTQNPAGSAVSYVSAPLAADTTVVGAGAVQLWVRSSTPRLDLQATITEVRPDGKETFVQNGWVRGDLRKLDPRRSTLLEPVLSLRRRDRAPLPGDRFEPVTIPLYYQGHPYRKGSRIRVIISAPNGDQPIWSFKETVPKGKASVAIAHGPGAPSRLLLPVVPGVDVPTELPPCPSLRGQPCRDYRALTNRRARR